MNAKPNAIALAGLVAAGLSLGGCATAGKLGGGHEKTTSLKENAKKVAEDDRKDAKKEREMDQQASGKIDKRARAAIEKEDVLSQMTFWAREQGNHPEDPIAAVKFSDILRRTGRGERAAEVASQGLDRNPENLDLLRAYGLSLISAGRSGEALRPLALLCKANLKDGKARSALGIALDEQGRYEEARQAYKEALALKPDDTAVLTNLGVSYLMTGESAKAEEILRQASALPDAGPQTRQNLALALGLQGRFGEAEQLAKVDLPPDLVANNMSYMHGLLSDDRRWGDLKKSVKR